jgi:hypothetical protein
LNQCGKISVHETKLANQPKNQNNHLGGDRKKNQKDLFDLTNGLISFLTMLSGLASERIHERRKSVYRQRSDRESNQKGAHELDYILFPPWFSRWGTSFHGLRWAPEEGLPPLHRQLEGPPHLLLPSLPQGE